MDGRVVVEGNQARVPFHSKTTPLKSTQGRLTLVIPCCHHYSRTVSRRSNYLDQNLGIYLYTAVYYIYTHFCEKIDVHYDRGETLLSKAI
jgi:hypothetical protein